MALVLPVLRRTHFSTYSTGRGLTDSDLYLSWKHKPALHHTALICSTILYMESNSTHVYIILPL